MKQLDIVVPHKKLSRVNEILRHHKVGGLMFYEIKGRGRAEREPSSLQIDTYSTGERYIPEYGSRTKVEVIVPDSLAKPIIEDVLNTVSTGSSSDGKIFVKDISEVFDIGAKQIGEIAAS